MSTDIKIIEYDARNPIHKERFGALNREWLEEHFFIEEEDQAAFNDPKKKILDKDGVILLAESGGEIIGTGSLLKMDESSYEVAKMAVTRTHQGRGIGEEILIELLHRARARTKHVFIVSNTKLENAIKLYRRHGFRDSIEARHGHYARGNITLELGF